MIDFKQDIANILEAADIGLTNDELMKYLEIPQDTKLGDYALPCFRLAKTLRKAPNLIAEEIVAKIKDDPFFEKVEQVGGYVNMFVSRSEMVYDVVKEVVDKKEEYGNSDLWAGKNVCVEYSSPNICKPFHIGHIRSTIQGAAIANLYEAMGANVTRLNHLGDYGTQFGKQIVAYRLWGDKEAVEANPIPELLKLYTKFHVEAADHPELDDQAREAFRKLENGEKEEVELWQWFREVSLKEFGGVYDILGITFDNYNGESFYSDKMQPLIDELEEKGISEISQGATIVDLEDVGLPPCLVKKSDGSTLYLTRDIAAAQYRYDTWKFDRSIYVVASQQNLYFQQLIAVMKKLGRDWAENVVHVPFGMVSLKEGTMSTRSGRVVFLEDVLNRAVEKTKEIILEKGAANGDVDEIAHQVGVGAVIFQELANNRIKDYVFDWDRTLNFDGETGPYVQYTYARASSVIRKADEADVAKALAGDFDAKYLTGDAAYELAKTIYMLPWVIQEAAEKYEGSIVTRHVVDIAQAFNRFYHDEQVLVDDADERVAKLALVEAARFAIKKALSIICMEAPESM